MFPEHKSFYVSSECFASRPAGSRVPAYALIVSWASDTTPYIQCAASRIYALPIETVEYLALPRTPLAAPPAPRPVIHGHACAEFECVVPAPIPQAHARPRAKYVNLPVACRCSIGVSRLAPGRSSWCPGQFFNGKMCDADFFSSPVVEGTPAHRR